MRLYLPPLTIRYQPCSGPVRTVPGIEPGASGRMTVTLAPGQYELVCNLMGHHVSGTYSKLTVT